MSHRLVQRVLVILQHDDVLQGELERDGAAALAPFGLDAGDLAHFAAVDVRALRTDPLRKRRLLRTLAEELKASTTLLLAGTRSLAGLESFCSSPSFHRAVLRDLPLAPAFGEWIGHCLRSRGEPDAVTAGVLALETTRARCRRAAQANARPGLGLAPGVAVLAVDAAVLPLVQAIERWLFEMGLMPAALLCDDAPAPPRVPAPSGALDHLMLAPAGGHVTLSPVDADLYRVLAALAEPRARAQAVVEVANAGVPAGRAGSLVESLLLEGLLAEGPPPGAARLA